VTEHEAASPGPESDIIDINRDQRILEAVDIEQLIAADHPARLFWSLTGQLNLSAYHAAIKTKRGHRGRPTYDPRLLVSIWLYAYQRGIGSAREVERMCHTDPGMRWLTGLKIINHHSLSDFRVENDQALKGLMEQVLGMLTLKRLITLERVTQDGTKILARVRNNSFRREGRIREHLEATRKHIEEMGDPRTNPDRKHSAQRRAAKERVEKLEEALAEIEKLQQSSKPDKPPQVSETDPEARFMHTRGSGVMPCYNVQITTDAAHGLIVDIEASNSENDAHHLAPAMDRVEQALQQKPKQVVADTDYTNYETVNAMAERAIDFYGSWPPSVQKPQEFSRDQFRWNEEKNEFICPAGQVMRQLSTLKTTRGDIHIYRATKGTCAECPHRAQCCGSNQQSDRTVSRRVDGAAVAAFKAKMAQESAQVIYKTRSQTAEFPNLWIKAKLGLRQFRTQGLRKAGMEARWAALTYNLQRYFQLVRQIPATT